MKTIAEMMTKKPAEIFSENMQDMGKDWYFSGWIQKLILIICFLWTTASGIYLLWRLIA